VMEILTPCIAALVKILIQLCERYAMDLIQSLIALLGTATVTSEA